MLTDTAVKKAKKKARRYKLTDHEGLYLAIMPTGKKVFRYEYRFHERRETLTLGTYSETSKGFSLIQARSAMRTPGRCWKRSEPGSRQAQSGRRAAAKIANSFRAVADAYITEISPTRSAPGKRRRTAGSRGALLQSSVIFRYPRLSEPTYWQPASRRLIAARPILQSVRGFIADVFSFAESLG